MGCAGKKKRKVGDGSAKLRESSRLVSPSGPATDRMLTLMKPGINAISANMAITPTVPPRRCFKSQVA
jgi:hypothetical protein